MRGAVFVRDLFECALMIWFVGLRVVLRYGSCDVVCIAAVAVGLDMLDMRVDLRRGDGGVWQLLVAAPEMLNSLRG